jgi:putative ABC transport system permease protein
MMKRNGIGDLLTYNIRIFLRKVIRNRKTFFINVAGLSAGLACVLLIIIWLADELSTDKFHANERHLFQIIEFSDAEGSILTNPRTTGLLADILKGEFPEIKYITNVRETDELTVSDKNIFLKGTGLYAGKEFFDVFTFPLLEGDKNTVLTNKNSIVLSKDLAVKIFGSYSSAVGKIVTLRQNIPFVVTGISENVPFNSTLKFDFILSFELFKDLNPNSLSWSNNSTGVYLVLKDGADRESFNMKIKDVIKEKSSDKSRTLSTRLYSDSYLYSNYQNGIQKGGRIEYVRIIALIAFLILLIACINYMNLSTANASLRLKEIGLKKAIGSGRKTLILQFLGESIFLTFISLLIALLIVDLILPSFNEITGKHLTLAFSIPHLTIIFFVLLITGIVAGSYPAFYLSGLNTITALKGKIGISAGEVVARKGLVIFQFILSVILIVYVLAIYSQIKYVQNKDLGYNKENIVYFDIDENIQHNLDAFLSALQRVDGIEKASSMGTNIVGGNNTFNSLDWPGKTSDEKIIFQMRAVNYGMIELFDIPIIQGRYFSRDFGSEDNKVVFNQAAIDVMGLKEPIGTKISIQGTKLEIIGVTKDFHFASLYNEIKPLFFVLRPSWTHIVMAKIARGKEQPALKNLVNFYKQYYPGKQLDYKFLDDTYQSQYIAEQRVSILVRSFAVLAILISCMGLLGLSAYNAERRRKEISIRKIFGQSALQISVQLSGEFIKLVLTSVIIALPVSYLITDIWLSNFAYRVTFLVWYYLGAGIIALLIAILTVGSQAIHSAYRNPVDALKYE